MTQLPPRARLSFPAGVPVSAAKEESRHVVWDLESSKPADSFPVIQNPSSS